MKATSLLPSQSHLGEGPAWFRNTFWWVDIEQMQLLCATSGQEPIKSFSMPERIGFAVPGAQGDWIIGLQSGLYRWNEASQDLLLLHSPEPDVPGNRFNDGKCDPTGRLWAGTMTMKGETGAGSLYRVDNNGCERVLTGITISNGLAWDMKRRRMYYNDTPTQEVAVFDYNPESATLSNREVLSRIPEETGHPDGMTIDTNGNLWVALWGGHAVVKIDPESGAIIDKVDVPAPNVTSCAFGGENLDTLFITTAQSGMSEEDLKQFPEAGNVFSVNPGCRGLPIDLVDAGAFGSS